MGDLVFSTMVRNETYALAIPRPPISANSASLFSSFGSNIGIPCSCSPPYAPAVPLCVPEPIASTADTIFPMVDYVEYRERRTGRVLQVKLSSYPTTPEHRYPTWRVLWVRLDRLLWTACARLCGFMDTRSRESSPQDVSPAVGPVLPRVVLRSERVLWRQLGCASGSRLESCCPLDLYDVPKTPFFNRQGPGLREPMVCYAMVC